MIDRRRGGAGDRSIGSRDSLDRSEPRGRRIYDGIERQERDVVIASPLSPMVATTALSATLAGTDFSRHRAFVVPAEHYRLNLVNMMNDAVMHQVRNHTGMASPTTIGCGRACHLPL